MQPYTFDVLLEEVGGYLRVLVALVLAKGVDEFYRVVVFGKCLGKHGVGGCFLVCLVVIDKYFLYALERAVGKVFFVHVSYEDVAYMVVPYGRGV
ncbi:hypothetical protein NXX53_06070 [Bacteroides salyersiae]|nr:hypothetical protein [Bacteroides salyersiae]